jgi:hypothetical protein
MSGNIFVYLKTSFLIVVCLLSFLSLTVNAQNTQLQSDLQKSFKKYELVKLNPSEVNSLIRRDGKLKIVTAEQTFDLNLVPHDLRAANFRAEETGTDGALHPVVSDSIKTYKGKINGDAASWARLSVSADGVEGLISTNGQRFLIEPAKTHSRNAAANDFVIYEMNDVKHETSVNCESHLHEKLTQTVSEVAVRDSVLPNVPFRVIELATEADFEYVSLLGGSAQTNNEILGILNTVEGVYEEQLGLTFSVVYQHTWTTADPYPQGGDMVGLLMAFRDYWNTNFPTTAVPRNLAHLWTNKAAFAGTNARGIAFQNVVCRDQPNAYSATGRRNEDFAFNINYLLAAHEIAHTLNASHAETAQNCGETIMNQILSNITPMTFCGMSRQEVTGFVSTTGSCLRVQQSVTNASRFDFEGDGKSDLAVFRPNGGLWFITNSSNNAFRALQFGANGDRPVPADYDGDGKTDVAVYRGGVWYRLKSSTNGFDAVSFGVAGDYPAAADFDGDRKADLAVFRPENGTWYRIFSSTGAFSAVQFGANGDVPTAADFDGDNKADLAVFRSSNGVWYRVNSSNGAFSATQFGAEGDKVVPADYDGDGKADIAVYRPTTGVWYVLKSANNTFGVTAFGLPTDLPTADDFDGDGKADVAVFRPETGTWYRLNSSNGAFSAIQFGLNGDRPAQNSFVY